MNKPAQKGFTLLEIMVAIAIIAIAFISILKLHTSTVATDIASNFYAKAPLLARKIMAEWKTGMVTEGSASNLNDSFKEFPNFTFEIDHNAIASDLLDPDTTDEKDSALVEITCTISYNNGEYHYTAKSLEFMPQ